MKVDFANSVSAVNHDGEDIAPVVPEAMVPAGTRCVELHSSAQDLARFHSLDVAEQALVENAVERRKADFGDSRWCAHEAMRSLVADEPIMRGARGMPVFPDGISGSLTHTEGFRAALVGHSHRWRSLGIDAEPARNLPDGVLQAIANRHERRRLRNLSANHGVQCADTVLFSAKEATYKAWFPLTQRFLDFDQADIDLRADGTFTSYLLVRPVPVPFIQGRWLVKNGVVVTIAAVGR